MTPPADVLSAVRVALTPVTVTPSPGLTRCIQPVPAKAGLNSQTSLARFTPKTTAWPFSFRVALIMVNASGAWLPEEGPIKTQGGAGNCNPDKLTFTIVPSGS